jgi:GntR family transcriptional regulator/MocR family aminotransferase
MALLDWTRRADTLVLEDDYDAEFRYDRQPIAALQGLAPEHVIYAGSASKTLAPGLRLGWIVAPPAVLDIVVVERWLADRQPSGLDHLVLAELIDGADYERHIRRTRLHYRRRRDELAAALPPSIAELNGERARAGLHALVRLPAGTSEAAVVERLALAGVAVHPLARYGSDVGPGLVVGYATPPQHAWHSGLKLLASTLESYLGPAV